MELPRQNEQGESGGEPFHGLGADSIMGAGVFLMTS
jgi:hypothetical protein